MPTLYGKKRTTVELSVANVAHATTLDPEGRQGSVVLNEASRISDVFAQGSEHGTLAEYDIPDETGLHLRLLGEDQSIPFKLVRAGKAFFARDHQTEKKTRRPVVGVKAQTTNDSAVFDQNFVGSGSNGPEGIVATLPSRQAHRRPRQEHALSINIFLSHQTFSYGKLDGHQKKPHNDVKVDVYLNGRLIESRFVTHSQFRSNGDRATNARAMRARVMRITGNRLSRLIEKPLVLKPSVPRQHRNSQSHAHTNLQCPESLSERWNTVSKALLEEANSYGLTKTGDQSVISNYLQSLGTYPIPSDLSDEQASGLAIGIIDVVIVHGNGSKQVRDGKYMMEPTRIPVLDSGETTTSRKARASLTRSRTSASIPAFDGSAETRRRSSTDLPANRNHAQYSALRPSGRSQTPLTRNTRTPSVATPFTRKHSRTSSLASSSSVKRRRSDGPRTEIVTNYPPTLEQQFLSSAEQGKISAQRTLSARRNVAKPSSPVVKKKTAAEPNSSPLSSVPPEDEVDLLEMPKESMVVTLKMSPTKPSFSIEKSAAETSRGMPLAVDTMKLGGKGHNHNVTNLNSSNEALYPTPIRTGEPSAGHTITQPWIVETPVISSRDMATAAGRPAIEGRSNANSNEIVAMLDEIIDHDPKTLGGKLPELRTTVEKPPMRSVSHTSNLPTPITPVQQRAGLYTTQPMTMEPPAKLITSFQPQVAGERQAPSHFSQPSNANPGGRPVSPSKQAKSPVYIPSEASSSEEDEAPSIIPANIAKNAAFDENFQMPALDKGCCVSFAGRGVVRNVPAVMIGAFEDQGVIMGVRFIVG